jgi:valyl-tRNA synthetase
MKLSKTYEPSLSEPTIYALWEQAQAFQPTGTGRSFSIVVPPPNANGDLHIGHALTLTLQDIAVRYHRLKGDKALLLPGADHAGFETQVVYEKQLAKQGKSRFDFSREELYDQIYDFVSQNRTNFEEQFKRLGAGVDWGRYTFTLDTKIVSRAYATFKKMWDEGLVYRGERLVNYCTYHRTGFADIEVEYEDARTPLYYLQYGPFVVATTRPETIFGDTAVAVHPKDDRYTKYQDTVITVEGPNGPFEVPVIADDMVDPAFGTGVVKITPAHSLDDWDAAQRHNLPAKRIINHDGTLNHLAGQFEGMTVADARKAVVKVMDAKGLIVKVEDDYRTRIGKCYKCGTVIEPMLMEQWFVAMQPLVKPAITALQAGKITFYPQAKQQQLIDYLTGLRDWNISRQIAWGIPIPAFQNVDDHDDWIYDERVDQEILERDGKTYRRDPDVFDTWFSSSSWPYATLDYPDGHDFKDFYPLSLMETGGEILYPWVSRMIMLGLYVTGRVPFTAVYIHGYVLAEDGSKMSKSVGNVINPLGVIDEYGADALRIGLITGRAPAINRGYDYRKVEGGRNFCNKLWNVARYVEDKVGGQYPAQSATPHPTSAADSWILDRLQQSIQTIGNDLETYRFSEAFDTLYHFVWDDFADWYIEATKVTLNVPVLTACLEAILKLAHPFAPFATETIWQALEWHPDALLATDEWPRLAGNYGTAAVAFERIKQVVTEVRAIKSTLGITEKLQLTYSGSLTAADMTLIRQLAQLSDIVPGEDGLRLLSSDKTTTLRIALDPAAIKAYKDAVAKQEKAAARSIAHLEARLANTHYLQKAPAVVVGETKRQLAAAQERLQLLQKNAGRFA